MSTLNPNEITPEMLAQFAAMQANQVGAVGAPVMPAAEVAPVMAPAINPVTAPVMSPVEVAPTPIISAEIPSVPVTESAVTPTQETIVDVPTMPAMVPSVEQMLVAPATTPATTPNLPVMDGNGLDLEGLMSPEEVNLSQKEVEAKPITINGLSNVGSCKTSVWGAFIKITEFIAKDLGNNDIIVIDNGTIDTHKEGVFIHCDMQNILGNISLNITAPDSSVKLLKLIKGGDLVQIFREDATQSYIFCNIAGDEVKTRVKTKLAADASVNGFGKAPELGTPIRQKEISNADKEIIKTIIAGKSAMGSDEPYRFGFSNVDDSLVSIGVGKDFTYFFQDSGIKTTEFRVYNPFPVPNMDCCIIRIFKDADPKKRWIQTVSNIEISSIVCTECVEVIDTSIEDYSFI